MQTRGMPLLRGEPEQGKPLGAGMLLGEAGFLQWTLLQAFFWQGEHLLEIKAKMPHTVSTLKRLLCRAKSSLSWLLVAFLCSFPSCLVPPGE